MKKTMLLFAAMVIATGGWNNAFAEQEEEEEELIQDFLLMAEGAYVQEKGEIELGIDVSYFDDQFTEEEDGEIESTHVNTYTAAIFAEYGITDRLSVEAWFPYLNEETSTTETTFSENGIGDSELELSYALTQEDDDIPAISVALEVSVPTGDEKKRLGSGVWGVGVSVGFSDHLTDDLTLHGRVGYERADNAEEWEDSIVEKSDEEEYSYSVAVGYRLSENMDLMLELAGEYELETNIDDETTYTGTAYVVPGFKYEIIEDLSVGVGVALGITDSSYDFGTITKLQYEL